MNKKYINLNTNRLAEDLSLKKVEIKTEVQSNMN